MQPKQIARRLRRNQTPEEKQLWRALRDGRFAGFKFRRQHDVGSYFLDFYCALARLSIELDGFQHGMPAQNCRDAERRQWLAENGIEELRFWNHQWRNNRDGVLMDIWSALYRRTGCAQVDGETGKLRFIAPNPEKLAQAPITATG